MDLLLTIHKGFWSAESKFAGPEAKKCTAANIWPIFGQKMAILWLDDCGFCGYQQNWPNRDKNLTEKKEGFGIKFKTLLTRMRGGLGFLHINAIYMLKTGFWPISRKPSTLWKKVSDKNYWKFYFQEKIYRQKFPHL